VDAQTQVSALNGVSFKQKTQDVAMAQLADGTTAAIGLKAAHVAQHLRLIDAL
jgi:hypothetical protein